MINPLNKTDMNSSPSTTNYDVNQIIIRSYRHTKHSSERNGRAVKLGKTKRTTTSITPKIQSASIHMEVAKLNIGGSIISKNVWVVNVNGNQKRFITEEAARLWMNSQN
jgi:hypothetical protein